MNTPEHKTDRFGRCLRWIIAFTVFSTSALYFTTGCPANQIIYYKNQKFVDGSSDKTLSCDSAIIIRHYFGLAYANDEGAHRSKDWYGIYYKNGANSPTEFYFSMSEPFGSPEVVEAKGSVQLLPDNYVLIDVHYKNSSGNWVEPPINGRQKINVITPPWHAAWPEKIFGPFF